MPSPDLAFPDPTVDSVASRYLMAAEIGKKGTNEKEDIRGETAYSPIEASIWVRKRLLGRVPTPTPGWHRR
jgi:hypothetical protein